MRHQLSETQYLNRLQVTTVLSIDDQVGWQMDDDMNNSVKLDYWCEGLQDVERCDQAYRLRASC